MLKNCSKCEKEFQCRVDKIEQCQCSKHELSAELLKEISEKYDNCLCSVCLSEINEQTHGLKGTK
jgi:hypothetical protein